MKDIILSELQTVYQEMKPEQEATAALPAARTIGLLVDFSNIARREGLIGLERYVEDRGDFQSRMIMMMVDGYDWEEIETTGIAEYISKNSKAEPAERLQILMDIAGLELLIDKANPHVIESRLLAMAPQETNELLEGEEEKARTELDERVREDYQPEDLVKKYCNSGDSDYSRDQMVEQLTDRAMRKLDGINMERFLREVENKDIAVAIKMLSGDAVTHIFSAMSPELARMIAEDVEYMGPVRVKDVESSCMILLKALVRLADAWSWPAATLQNANFCGRPVLTG